MTSNKASEFLIIMREARNLSQRSLASRVNLANTAISQAENGNASEGTWIKLAEYFKMSADSLLWLAGQFKPVAPPKAEILEKLRYIQGEMQPQTLRRAKELEKWIEENT